MSAAGRTAASSYTWRGGSALLGIRASHTAAATAAAMPAAAAIPRLSRTRASIRAAPTGMLEYRVQADVAQLVEQSIRNRQVIGSSPIVGSILRFCYD